MELIHGHVYEAKKPQKTFLGFYNDRQITYLSDTQVQYDSPTVCLGGKYPTIAREKFEKWAGKDVTEEMPANLDWRTERKE